ncbi:CHAT domain-containing protein [Nostoc sp. FACHB-152]|nr:CHAT domain-containing protein [Nostoc sp. FACHB-152]MBD2467672.1 CHAT domain-containing protein [Nostoc sp. FACHB-145]
MYPKKYFRYCCDFLKKKWQNNRNFLKFIFGILLGASSILLLAETGIVSNYSQAAPPLSIVQTIADTAKQEEQGRQYYQAEQFLQAIQVWQPILNIYKSQSDKLNSARVLNNLSLAYQQLGQWSQAAQAINESLQLLQVKQGDNSLEQLQVLAQTLNTQGSLQLALGDSQTALITWQQAHQTYLQAKDETGAIRTLLNQSQALRALGLYRKALESLTQIRQILEKQPDSLIKAAGLRSLGTSLSLVGRFQLAEKVLQQSLAIAQNFQSQPEISAALIELGNVARANQNPQLALNLYQQATAISSTKLLKIRPQLNQLSVAIDTQQWSLAQSLWQKIPGEITDLPVTRASIYAQLNFAQSLIRLYQANISDSPTLKTIAQFVGNTVMQAQKLGDKQAQSYALGKLGTLYEKTQQWSLAQEMTLQALTLAETINAPEIAYRWQWQLGRILTKQGDIQGAFAAYTQAVNHLQSLRSDLIAVAPDIQFSFQESVEPVYRELVSLLLKPGTQPNQKSLQQARQLIESLQLAELEDFFREACVDHKPAEIDRIDTQAAIFYPIILADRLEIIYSLPHQPLQHYTSHITQNQLENLVEDLRQNLVIRTKNSFMPLSQQIYSHLLRPSEDELTKSGVKTLVFVLDGVLRNIPMAALHDGNQFLLQKYNIALFPGLQMQPHQQLATKNIRVLGAGLTQARQGFSPLEYVELELKKINAEVKSVVLLDQEFTQENLQKQIKSNFFPIIHIATHGQFSSKAIETFILTWNDRLRINDLDNLLQIPQQRKQQTIDLLVLSACETATGDKRAALGLAGLAIRAGASSTLATLWSVNDEATSTLMDQFYKELQQPKKMKAEALRNAQLALLKDPLYNHPVYWSPYVLVGNWQ